nr:YccF domain-containing protein [Bifidobacterium pseudocatenulatum]
MRVLGNILWIILGGLAIAIGWALVELILCITIIGIPFGLQSFKMAKLALWPFGAEIVNL